MSILLVIISQLEVVFLDDIFENSEFVKFIVVIEVNEEGGGVLFEIVDVFVDEVEWVWDVLRFIVVKILMIYGSMIEMLWVQGGE